MKNENSPHLYAIITIIFWSLAYVLTRMVLVYFTALSLGFLRYFIASIVLIIFAGAVKLKIPERKDFKWFALSGAMGFFLYMIAFNIGSKNVTASTSSLLLSLVPIITALLSHCLYKEKLRAFQWIAIMIAFTGIIILTMLKGDMVYHKSMVWLLLSACCLSIYNLLQRKLTQRYSALQAAIYSILIGTIMLSLIFPRAMKEIKGASVTYLFYIILLGIFPSALAYVSWSKALANAKSTSMVSNYMFLTPFLTALWERCLIGETIDFSIMLGGTVILSGLLIFSLGGKFNAFIPDNKSERK